MKLVARERIAVVDGGRCLGVATTITIGHLFTRYFSSTSSEWAAINNSDPDYLLKPSVKQKEGHIQKGR